MTYAAILKKQNIDRFHVTSSLSKDPPKFSFSSGIRGDIFISVYNFTAQQRASFGNQSILNFRVMEVRDTRLRSNLLKNMLM